MLKITTDAGQRQVLVETMVLGQQNVSGWCEGKGS